MNVEYFNITYRCNSNCLLCAANIGTGYRDIEEMSLDDFLQAIANRRMKANDRVIINGGEPTTSEYFFDILDACNSRSFFIDLFTNGKKFSDRSFCERVLECLNIHIRIPLFGCQETHDQLTGQTGNFNDVINGIKNIHLLLQESQSLEIKLLPLNFVVILF